jgi:hypothetical protein
LRFAIARNHNDIWQAGCPTVLAQCPDDKRSAQCPNREPNLAKKWIGQKKAIRQWQVFRKFYDDAIEVLLKFCGGSIKVL